MIIFFNHNLWHTLCKTCNIFHILAPLCVYITQSHSCHVKKYWEFSYTSDWQKERQETSEIPPPPPPSILLHFVSFLLVHISFFLTFNFHFWRKFSSGVWNSLCSTPCLPPPPPPCAPSSSRLPHYWFSEMTWFSKPSNFSAGFTSSSVSSKLLKEICFLSHIHILLLPPKFQILHTSSPRLSSNFFMIKKN